MSLTETNTQTQMSQGSQQTSPRAHNSRYTQQELKILIRRGDEKHRQKLAKQQDPSQRVTISWRDIAKELDRDVAAVQAKYLAIRKSRQEEAEDIEEGRTRSASELKRESFSISDTIEDSRTSSFSTVYTGSISSACDDFSEATLSPTAPSTQSIEISNFLASLMSTNGYNKGYASPKYRQPARPADDEVTIVAPAAPMQAKASEGQRETSKKVDIAQARAKHERQQQDLKRKREQREASDKELCELEEAVKLAKETMEMKREADEEDKREAVNRDKRRKLLEEYEDCCK